MKLNEGCAPSKLGDYFTVCKSTLADGSSDIYMGMTRFDPEKGWDIMHHVEVKIWGDPLEDMNISTLIEEEEKINK